MKKVKYILLVSCLLLLGSGGEVVSQNKKLDSLLTLLKTDKQDTNKVKHLNKISELYWRIGSYDTAIVLVNQALAITETSLRALAKQSVSDAEIASLTLAMKKGKTTAYNTLGNVYWNQADYPKALDYYFKALKMREELGDKSEIAINLGNIGSLYTKTSKYKEAETYLLDALKMDKEIGAQDGERDDEEKLSELYEQTGRHKEALLHYKSSILLKDTLFSQENHKSMIRKEMNFEFDKKEAVAMAEHKNELEKQAAIAEEKSKKQKIVIWSVVGGLLLVVVFAGFVFRSLRVTRKQKHVIELQKDEVSRQKTIVEKQKHLVEEHQKEIIDSINYAERIQRSFIATKELLDENLNDYFVLFKPKDIVSGDFYWASKLNNGNFALATADSTGHGVPGAIMSLLNVTSLEKAIENNTQPSDILNATRKIIIERLKKDGSAEGGKDGMDASLTVYDFTNNKLFVA
ncbi:MAG TPA: tetratricopeptide repeat protein, partial [Bacteroidia bacterium]